jgi:hypothetical protein
VNDKRANKAVRGGLVSQSRLHVRGPKHNSAILSTAKLSTPFLRSNSNPIAPPWQIRPAWELGSAEFGTRAPLVCANRFVSPMLVGHGIPAARPKGVTLGRKMARSRNLAVHEEEFLVGGPTRGPAGIHRLARSRMDGFPGPNSKGGVEAARPSAAWKPKWTAGLQKNGACYRPVLRNEDVATQLNNQLPGASAAPVGEGISWPNKL